MQAEYPRFSNRCEDFNLKFKLEGRLPYFAVFGNGAEQ